MNSSEPSGRNAAPPSPLALRVSRRAGRSPVGSTSHSAVTHFVVFGFERLHGGDQPGAVGRQGQPGAARQVDVGVEVVEREWSRMRETGAESVTPFTYHAPLSADRGIWVASSSPTGEKWLAGTQREGVLANQNSPLGVLLATRSPLSAGLQATAGCAVIRLRRLRRLQREGEDLAHVGDRADVELARAPRPGRRRGRARCAAG